MKSNLLLSNMTSKPATLSTLIDPAVKAALSKHCKKKGLKIRYLIESAIVEQLEDEADLEAYRARKDEPRVAFKFISPKKS